MTDKTNRREVIATLGATALAVAGVDKAAADGSIRGNIVSDDGKPIAEGELTVHLERRGVAEEAKRRVAKTQIKSDGKQKTIAFEIAAPAAVLSEGDHDLVATLRRADGWLIARGSTDYRAGAVAELTLNIVMY